jgi:glycogen phosphorylase
MLIVKDLSLEFLMGRALDNAMLNVGQKDIAASKYDF